MRRSAGKKPKFLGLGARHSCLRKIDNFGLKCVNRSFNSVSELAGLPIPIPSPGIYKALIKFAVQ